MRGRENVYVSAVERGVDVVHAVAAHGLDALRETPGTQSLRSLGERPLAPLLGAWSKLSIGRVGLLDDKTSVRLPWIVFSAFAPALVALMVARVEGLRTGLFAGAWLLSMRSFQDGAITGSSGVALGTSWLCVLAPYSAALVARNRRRVCLGLFGALGLALGVGVVLAAGWVLLLVGVHYVLLEPARSTRMAARGGVSAPATLVFSGLLLPLGLVGLDPALWSADPVQLVSAFAAPFSEEPARSVSGAAGFLSVAPVSAWLWGAIGLGAFAIHALGRHFATGAFRPRRDASGLGLLVWLGVLACATGPRLLPGFLSSGEARFEIALPFVAMAAAAGAEFAGKRLVEARDLGLFEGVALAVSVLLHG